MKDKHVFIGHICLDIEAKSVEEAERVIYLASEKIMNSYSRVLLADHSGCEVTEDFRKPSEDK